jgi:hypothetical protein
VADDKKVYILLCDGAVQSSKKWTLVGLFDLFWADRFPAPIGGYAYVHLKDVLIGDGLTVGLEIRDNLTPEQGGSTGTLWSCEANVKPSKNDKAAIGRTSIGYALPIINVKDGVAEPVLLPREGTYDLNVLVNGELIDVATVVIKKRQVQHDGGDGE